MKFIVNGTNKEYYSSLAKTVSGVECVNVVPRKDGVGTVTVYVSGREMELGALTIYKVQSLMDKEREVNVNVKVVPADLVPCIVEIGVELENGYSIEAVRQQLFDKIKEIIDKLEVGESLSLLAVNDILYHTEGLKSYKVLESISTGYMADPYEKIVLEKVYLRED